MNYLLKVEAGYNKNTHGMFVSFKQEFKLTSLKIVWNFTVFPSNSLVYSIGLSFLAPNRQEQLLRSLGNGTTFPPA